METVLVTKLKLLMVLISVLLLILLLTVLFIVLIILVRVVKSDTIWIMTLTDVFQTHSHLFHSV